MSNEINKNCHRHGETEFIIEANGYHRCKKCRSESVTRNRRRRKKHLVELKGGKCEICGYDKCQRALQFHHLNPSEKQFGISSKGLTHSKIKMEEEVKKCMLVCANCHAEIEAGIIVPQVEELNYDCDHRNSS